MARRNWTGSKWIRKDKRLAIYLRDGMCCAYCGETVEDGVKLTLDHLLAAELGGTNEETNLVTCCLGCNSAKRDHTIREWYATLRDRGIDTDKISRRIRRLVKRPLDRVAAKALLAARRA